MPAISRLFPDAKVIACVRDVSWVVDSIEKLVQRNVFSPSSIFNYSAGGTVYTRANAVVAPDGMVGGPYDALKQACYGSQRDRLLLVQYDTLTSDPGKTMHAIYDFLDEPYFDHDFDNVDYRTIKVQTSRVMRARPKVPVGWQTTHHFELFDDVLDKRDLVNVMDSAGRLYGLGDWRPTYGRFTVEVV
jgi:hypothetical protein